MFGLAFRFVLDLCLGLYLGLCLDLCLGCLLYTSYVHEYFELPKTALTEASVNVEITDISVTDWIY